MESPPEGGVSPRADFFGALVWVILGGGIAVSAWRMDRLEHLHINRYEVPGLVPGLLGAALLLLGVLLALRALGRGALRPVKGAGAEAPTDTAGRARMAGVLGAMLLYPLVLVGHELPFWLATSAFVSAFIFFFDRPRQSALGRSTARQALLALACGVLTGALVTFVFQELFYVRLP